MVSLHGAKKMTFKRVHGYFSVLYVVVLVVSSHGAKKMALALAWNDRFNSLSPCSF